MPDDELSKLASLLADASAVKSFTQSIKDFLAEAKKGKGDITATTKAHEAFGVAVAKENQRISEEISLKMRLVEAINTMNVKSKEFGATADLLNRVLGSSRDEVSNLQTKIEELKSAQKKLTEGGKDTSGINRDLAATEKELFRLRQQNRLASAGQLINEGGWKNFGNAIMEVGKGQVGGEFTKVLETLMDLGVVGAKTAETIMGFATVILFIGESIASAAKNALNASRAGMVFGSTSEALGQGAEFYLKAYRTSMSMLGTQGTDEVIKSVIELNKQYGLGLSITGREYQKVIAGNANLNENILRQFDYVKMINQVGFAFGMAADESIKLAAGINKVAHLEGREAVSMFNFLGEEAKRLGMPIQGMISVFDALAKSSENTGISADTFGGQLRLLEQSINSIGGAAGFVKMDMATLQSGMMQMVEGLSKVPVALTAVLSQKPGEGIFQALYRAQAGGAMGAMEGMYGLNRFIGGFDKTSMQNMTDRLSQGKVTNEDTRKLMILSQLIYHTPYKMLEVQPIVGALARGDSLDQAMKTSKATEMDSLLEKNMSAGQLLQTEGAIWAAMLTTLRSTLEVVTNIGGLLEGFVAGGLFGKLFGRGETPTYQGTGLQTITPTGSNAGGSPQLPKSPKAF